MKTLTTTAILSIMFLSAGAFAGESRNAQPVAPAAVINASNITVVEKNQAWPPAGRISVDPCQYELCYDI